MSDYFVVTMSEDGDARVDGPLSKGELETRLTPDAYGDAYYGSLTAAAKLPKDLNEIAGRGIVIIKGEVVVPRAVSTVTKYEVP